MGPSPFADVPWQVAQYKLKVELPLVLWFWA